MAECRTVDSNNGAVEQLQKNKRYRYEYESGGMERHPMDTKKMEQDDLNCQFWYRQVPNSFSH